MKNEREMMTKVGDGSPVWHSLSDNRISDSMARYRYLLGYDESKIRAETIEYLTDQAKFKEMMDKMYSIYGPGGEMDTALFPDLGDWLRAQAFKKGWWFHFRRSTGRADPKWVFTDAANTKDVIFSTLAEALGFLQKTELEPVIQPDVDAEPEDPVVLALAWLGKMPRVYKERGSNPTVTAKLWLAKDLKGWLKSLGNGDLLTFYHWENDGEIIANHFSLKDADYARFIVEQEVGGRMRPDKKE